MAWDRLAWDRENYPRYRERKRASMRAYYEANKEDINAKRREWYAREGWLNKRKRELAHQRIDTAQRLAEVEAVIRNLEGHEPLA